MTRPPPPVWGARHYPARSTVARATRISTYTLKCYNSGTGAANFRYFGTAEGFDSKVLQPQGFKGRITIARTDGQPFNLKSFDFAAGRWGAVGDLIATGTKAEGGTYTTRQLNFTTKTMSTQTTTWWNVTEVNFEWAGEGSTSGTFGTIDNLIVQ